MNGSAHSRWWVRVHVSSLDELAALREKFQIEILRSSLRRIDSHNFFVDCVVTESSLKKLQALRRTQVLGDLEQMARESSRYVSRSNRYREP